VNLLLSGQKNAAKHVGDSISGGWNNFASLTASSITGGEFNKAEGERAAIDGGYKNTETGTTARSSEAKKPRSRRRMGRGSSSDGAQLAALTSAA
jgi:hypothetical protein